MHMALLDSTMSSMKSWYWLPISPWALHIVCTCTRAGHEAACNWPSHKLATDPPSWHRLLRCLVSFPGPFSRLEKVVSCYQLNSWRKVGYLEAHTSFWHFRSFLGWSLMFTGDRKIRHSLFLSNKLASQRLLQRQKAFWKQTLLLTVPMVDVLGEPEDVSF